MRYRTWGYPLASDPASAARNVISGSAPWKWKLDPTLPLDKALPVPWPKRYLTLYRQPFSPNAFWLNMVALANYPDDPNAHAMVRGLYQRLLDYSELRDGARFVLYRFDRWFRQHMLTDPWTSAYASGAALVACSLMHTRFGLEEAAQTADEILTGLERFDSDMWVSMVDGRDYLWFEEIPLDPAPHILPGHLRVLQALHGHWVLTNDPRAKQLLLGGLRTAEDHVPLYRRPGEVAKYDLLPNWRPDYGLTRAINLQDAMFKISGDPVFADYRDQFRDDMEHMADDAGRHKANV